MRVLVTGAGGFIGAEVTRRLVSTGHEVIAFERPGASTHRLEGDLRGRFTMTQGDVGDAAAVQSSLAAHEPDGIIHLAWHADPRDYLTSKENLRSLAATNGFVDQALSAGCARFVVAGSCAEYAPTDRPLREDDAAAPATLYGRCKLAASMITRSLAETAGARLAWARIFHLHGPAEDPRRLIPWVASELRAGRPVDLTDGAQVRDHLHVADVASGLVQLLVADAAGVFNICSGQPVTLRSVLETVGQIVGRPELLRFGARPRQPNDVMFLAGDATRLRATGWTPRFGLRDGLEDALRASI